jgi:hypothetical protein
MSHNPLFKHYELTFASTLARTSSTADLSTGSMQKDGERRARCDGKWRARQERAGHFVCLRSPGRFVCLRPARFVHLRSGRV